MPDDSLNILDVSIILFAADVILLGAGIGIFRLWTRDEQLPPPSFAFAVLLGAFISYCLLTRYLWLHTGAPDIGNVPREKTFPETSIKLQLSFAAVFMWTFPVGYFGNMLAKSIAARRAVAMSWFGADEATALGSMPPEEFEEARNRAALGDIDGAVEAYLSYRMHRHRAILAAATLLETHGRYAQAAQHLQDMAAEFAAEIKPWSEATFRLANIHENHLANHDEAVRLYNQIAVRAPNSEYGRTADHTVAKLRPGSDALLDMLDASYAPGPATTPYVRPATPTPQPAPTPEPPAPETQNPE